MHLLNSVILSALATTCYASIRVPIHPVTSSSSSSTTTTVKRQDTEDPLSLDSNGPRYDLAGSVGGQPIRWFIDTGSAVTWVLEYNTTQCTSATGCPYGSYNPANSPSTFHYINQSFAQNYGDGTYGVSGAYFTDTLTLGGAVLTDTTLGLAQTLINAQSPGQDAFYPGEMIFGLSYPSGTGLSPPPPVQRMVDLGYITRAAYSVWENSQAAGQGEIIFGGVDTGKFTGPLIAFNLINNWAGVDGSLGADMTAFALVDSNGVSHPLQPTGYSGAVMLLDTGTPSSTVIPPELFEPFISAIGASYEPDAQAYVVSCSLAQSTASLTYQFAGASGPVIKQPLSHFVGPQVDVPFVNPDGTTVQGCKLVDVSSYGSSNTGVLGLGWAQYAYMVFDLANHRGALAQAVTGSPASNVLDFDSGSAIPGAALTLTANPGAATSSSATTVTATETTISGTTGYPCVTPSFTLGVSVCQSNSTTTSTSRSSTTSSTTLTTTTSARNATTTVSSTSTSSRNGTTTISTTSFTPSTTTTTHYSNSTTATPGSTTSSASTSTSAISSTSTSTLTSTSTTTYSRFNGTTSSTIPPSTSSSSLTTSSQSSSTTSSTTYSTSSYSTIPTASTSTGSSSSWTTRPTTGTDSEKSWLVWSTSTTSKDPQYTDTASSWTARTTSTASSSLDPASTWIEWPATSTKVNNDGKVDPATWAAWPSTTTTTTTTSTDPAATWAAWPSSSSSKPIISDPATSWAIWSSSSKASSTPSTWSSSSSTTKTSDPSVTWAAWSSAARSSDPASTWAVWSSSTSKSSDPSVTWAAWSSTSSPPSKSTGVLVVDPSTWTAWSASQASFATAVKPTPNPSPSNPVSATSGIWNGAPSNPVSTGSGSVTSYAPAPTGPSVPATSVRAPDATSAYASVAVSPSPAGPKPVDPIATYKGDAAAVTSKFSNLFVVVAGTVVAVYLT